MNKAKNAVPPPQENRANTGQRQRDEKGKFLPGNKNGGRPKLRAEFKQFAQEKSLDTLKEVWSILICAGEKTSDRLTAARIMLEYGYGRPAAELDRERLDLDIKRMELDERRHAWEREQEEGPREQTIHVVYENAELTPEELAELAK